MTCAFTAIREGKKSEPPRPFPEMMYYWQEIAAGTGRECGAAPCCDAEPSANRRGLLHSPTGKRQRKDHRSTLERRTLSGNFPCGQKSAGRRLLSSGRKPGVLMSVPRYLGRRETTSTVHFDWSWRGLCPALALYVAHPVTSTPKNLKLASAPQPLRPPPLQQGNPNNSQYRGRERRSRTGRTSGLCEMV